MMYVFTYMYICVCEFECRLYVFVIIYLYIMTSLFTDPKCHSDVFVRVHRYIPK